MNIEVSSFKRLFPKVDSPDQWVEALNRFMPSYKINNLPRVSAFIAQCGHESQGFRRMVENLNYSATALMGTWPKRFNEDKANQYARKPEAIANYVYANRMGNGDEASGDGWKHRGKGLIQVTGKENQQAFADHVGMALDQVLGYMLTIEGAVHSACWLWANFGCNAIADTGDMKALTKRINGGLIGLIERNELFALVNRIFREDGLA